MDPLVDPLSQPRFLPGAKGQSRGVLLVHGFSGSPFELHLLAERLHQAGYHVALPLLAGHHRSLRALAESSWQDWFSSAEQALHELQQRVASTTSEPPQLAVVGFSMGGLLSLELSRRYPAPNSASDLGARGKDPPSVQALALLATPLWLPAWQERAIVSLARIGGLGRLAVPKLAGRDLRARDLPKAPLKPWGMPLRALASLVELMHEVRGHLGEVRQPTLLAHGQQDHTVPPDCLADLASGLGSPAELIERLVLPRSFHILPLDVEREQLFTALLAHIDRHLQRPTVGNNGPP